MHFHLAATTAKAIKVLPVMAVALAFSLLPAAPEAAAQGFGSFWQSTGVVTTTGTYYATDWDLPDLRVTYIDIFAIGWSPDYSGIYNYVTVEVSNYGRAQSPATKLRLWNGTTDVRLDVPTIPVNGRTSIKTQMYRALVGGNCVLVAHVDPSNQVRELSDANNTNMKVDPLTNC